MVDTYTHTSDTTTSITSGTVGLGRDLVDGVCSHVPIDPDQSYRITTFPGLR